MCLRVFTGFKGVSFRETHLWEHFGRTDQIALIACLKKLNVSSASLTQARSKCKVADPFGKWSFLVLLVGRERGEGNFRKYRESPNRTKKCRIWTDESKSGSPPPLKASRLAATLAALEFSFGVFVSFVSWHFSFAGVILASLRCLPYCVRAVFLQILWCASGFQRFFEAILGWPLSLAEASKNFKHGCTFISCCSVMLPKISTPTKSDTLR